jgi:hypothetical protein
LLSLVAVLASSVCFSAVPMAYQTRGAMRGWRRLTERFAVGDAPSWCALAGGEIDAGDVLPQQVERQHTLRVELGQRARKCLPLDAA